MLPYFSIPFEQYPRKNIIVPPPSVGGQMPPEMSSPYMPPSVPIPVPPPSSQVPMPSPQEEEQPMPEQEPFPEMQMPCPAVPAFPMNCPMMQMYPQMNMPMQNNQMMPYGMDMGMDMTGMDMNMEMGDEMAGTPRPGLYGDPPPILSNNPATASITLFKELTGYPNYGNPSRNADILYTGTRGTWTFDLPALITGNVRRGQIVIRAVLDDHFNVASGRYTARITINGTVVHNGVLPLAHGTPAGGMFTNWTSLTFNVPGMRRNNRVMIENTSRVGADDWMAFDWMEMRFTSR